MPGYLKEVNIKDDMPAAGDAIRRIIYHIHTAKALGAGAVKIIHGYGSSGKGGKIRVEVRRYLASQKSKEVIFDYIEGENFSIFDQATRSAFSRCGELRHDPDLERHNNGVTFIIL